MANRKREKEDTVDDPDIDKKQKVDYCLLNLWVPLQFWYWNLMSGNMLHLPEVAIPLGERKLDLESLNNPDEDVQNMDLSA